MRHIPILLSAMIALVIAGCEQQQPLAGKPPPTPGATPGETPPPVYDGREVAPPATAPTTPGVQNHPAAPSPLPPPPTTAPTTTPAAP